MVVTLFLNVFSLQLFEGLKQGQGTQFWQHSFLAYIILWILVFSKLQIYLRGLLPWLPHKYCLFFSISGILLLGDPSILLLLLFCTFLYCLQVVENCTNMHFLGLLTNNNGYKLVFLQFFCRHVKNRSRVAHVVLFWQCFPIFATQFAGWGYDQKYTKSAVVVEEEKSANNCRLVLGLRKPTTVWIKMWPKEEQDHDETESFDAEQSYRVTELAVRGCDPSLWSVTKYLSLRSAAGPVIQATVRSEFEDGLESGWLFGLIISHERTRTELPDQNPRTTASPCSLHHGSSNIGTVPVLGWVTALWVCVHPRRNLICCFLTSAVLY
jgi:hypothetical protein